MKKTITLGIVCCAFFQLFGQEKVELIDADAILKEAYEYQAEKDFQNALDAIKRVPANDSSYLSSLTSKTYYHTNLDQFDEAIEVANTGLKSNEGSLNYYFYSNKIAALIGKKSYTEAIETIDEALIEFPKNARLLYNKAIAYEGLEQYEKAAEMYQISITYNPFYANSHLKLGVLCYKHHLITQTMMCLNMYLLLNPDGPESFDILNAYNEMVKSKNTEDKLSGRISVDDDAFDEIDLIINNYAALNKSYKVSNKITLAMVKQNHAMMTQLNNFEGNGGFWDRYYVPFHKYIMNKGQFDGFAYTISYSVQNEKLKAVVDKNISTIKTFIQNYRGQIIEILSDWEVEFNGKKEKVTYFFNDSKLAGIGKVKDTQAVGYWEIFDENGRRTSFGNFNDNGEREGVWKWYTDAGIIAEEGEYDNGKLTNEYRSYHADGKLKTISQFKDGERNGPHKVYNEYGALLEASNYKNDVYDGEMITYYPIGEKYIKYKIPYVDGKVEGKVLYYFENGALRRELNFKNDLQDGKTTSYFINGDVETVEEFLAGKAVNKYTENHVNGKVYKEGSFDGGEKTGVWKIYFMDGTINSETTYKAGVMDGLFAQYDRDGKLHFEYIYKKGDIIAYKFFDKNGTVIKDAKKQAGSFFYQGHSPYGVVISEGNYSVSGGKIGEWKFYTDNHVLRVDEVLNDKSQMVKSTKYHENGAVKSITNFTNDTLTGYFALYRQNGKIEQQGWYVNGDAVGNWLTYYQDGTIEGDNYYSNGKRYGIAKFYAPDGKIATNYHYDNDLLIKETFFDQDGKIVEEIDVTSDSSEYMLINRYVNNNVNNSFTILHDIKNGPYLSYYFNGTDRVKGSYLHGEQHGQWQWFHENGKVEITGEYVLGDKHGVWKEFHDNGKLDEESTYLYGIQMGEQKTYNDKGILIARREYKQNMLHGRLDFYSEDGQHQVTRYYDHGRLIGYGHQDKTGKDIPMIPLEMETGKIVAYFANGKVSREMEYKNGSFVNAYKEYYSTGQMYEEQFYKDDLREGSFKRYYPNGVLHAEMTYSNGDLNGFYKEYHENGKLKEETQYLNDLKHGSSKFYNSTGKLIKERTYFNNEIFSEKTY